MMGRRRNREGRLRIIRSIVSYAIAALFAVPIVWLLLGAFRPNADIFKIEVPERLTLENFTFAVTQLPILRYLGNSAIVATAVTMFGLLFHSMAGYAIARLAFPGRRIIFGGMISTMLVSASVLLIPLFIIVKQFGLVDSYLGLIIPAVFSAFGIFLLRQYYSTFPKEVEEAAEVDGCSVFGTFFRIILPMSRGILTALGILFFLANWNAFLWPLTITNSPKLFVVQIGLAQLQGQYGSNWGVILALSVLAAIPTVGAFILGQKYILEALRTSGK